MGELARKRSVRSLGFAPTAVWALGTLMVAALLAVFFVGFRIGTSSAVSPEKDTPSWMVAETREESLSELLARVEASSSQKESLKGLSYPEALSGDAPSPQVTAEVEQHSAGQPLTLKGKQNVEAFADSNRPEGAFTVEVAHVEEVRLASVIWEIVKEQHKDSWVLTERTEGTTLYRIVVGSYGRASKAEAAQEDLQASLETLEIPVRWTLQVRSVIP